MKDPTAVLEKINKIISGGKDKLQVSMIKVEHKSQF